MAAPISFLTQEVRVSIVIVCVTAVVFGAFKLFNPSNGAEHYYKRTNKTAFRVLQICYFVIVVALFFNLRFLVVHLAKRGGREALARAVRADLLPKAMLPKALFPLV